MTVTRPATLIHQQSTTTGTGNFTLSTVGGKQGFSTAFGTGATTNVFDYFISNQSASEWERGTGHMSDATTLVRDTVVESTNANAAVSFSAGTKDVCNDFPAGSVQYALTASTGISISGAHSDTIAVSLSTLTNSLGADVNLNNTANFFDGPSVAQGTSGTWYASGTVVVTSATADNFGAKLWDGTTVIDVAVGSITAGGFAALSVSGYISSPAGNIRISARDYSTTSGIMKFNASGLSKDSTISVVRVA